MDPSPPPRSDAPPDPSDPDRPDVAEPVVPPDGTDGVQELIGTDGDRELIGADDDRHSRHDLALIASWVVVALTCIFDHDVVDGAPAARFATRLQQLIESGPLE